MKEITLDDVNIRIVAEREDISVEQAAKECGPGFEEAVRGMQAKSRRWGWCTVHAVSYTHLTLPTKA